MTTLTLKVTEILKTQIDNYAKKNGLSKSEIIRMALNEYFSKDDTKSLNSFLSFSEDLAGSIQAPSDLSKNKKYLEDYGK